MNDEAYRLKGLKFYRFPDETDMPEIIQLVKYIEEKKEYKMRSLSKGISIRVPKEELESKWIKLNPDGIMEFITCTAIDNQGEPVPDVMVTLRRKNENGVIDAKPYAVCRQAVIDIFVLLQQSKYIAGMTITEDTCPPEVRFDSCYRYAELKAHELVAVYNTDHLPDILKLINASKYNDQLRLIKSRDKTGIPGYYENLYDLLKNNYFMLDFHTAFGIHEFKFDEFDFTDRNTCRILTEYIIRNKYEVPSVFYPVPYGKQFDLREIKRHYILICPDSFNHPYGNITLLGYDVSQVVSFEDYINKGLDPKDALRKSMKDLGWS